MLDKIIKVAGIICMIILLTSIILLIISPFACRETKQVEIVSIRSSESISGSFVLGTGRIGVNTYYYSYIKLPDGELKLIQGEAQNTRIYEDMQIDTAYAIVKVENVGKMIKILDNPNYNNIFWIEFHIPKGTIIQEFQLR